MIENKSNRVICQHILTNFKSKLSDGQLSFVVGLSDRRNVSAKERCSLITLLNKLNVN